MLAELSRQTRALGMCRTGRHKTWCGMRVVKFNLARRPRPARPLYPEPETQPQLQAFRGLEVGRGSHAAPPRVLVAFIQKNSVRPKS